MTRRASLASVALSMIAAASVAGAPRAGAVTCATSAPPSAAFTATVCIDGVAPGDTLSGETTVLVTVSVTPVHTVRTVQLFLGSEYLASDLAYPWSVVIPTDRWADGSHTLSARAIIKNGPKWWMSAKTPVSAVFQNAAGGSSAAPFSAYEPPGSPGDTFTVAAVGDGAAGRGVSKTVVNRIAAWSPDVFLYLGDVYERGTFTEFRNWYGGGSTWYSRFRSITDPVPGNHEYTDDPSATGYRDYWGDPPHRYSFDVGAWHLIALDSTEEFAQVARGTAQFDWLVNDLHDAPACTLVYFHHPVYSAGAAPDARLAPMWRLLANEGVDVVLSGHQHRYERWKPMDADGVVDASGPTQYVVGTGGMSLYKMSATPPRMDAWSDTKFGALRLRLSPGTAQTTFMTAGGTVLDTATRACSLPVDHDPPSAPVLDAVATSSTSVDLSWTASSDDIGVTSYVVVRDGVAIATLPASTSGFTDDGLAANTGYDYTVRARDASGHATASNAVTVTTSQAPDTTPPDAPPNLTALAPDANTVSLDWDDATDDRGVEDYTVKRDGVLLAIVTDTAYTDTTAAPASTYSYSVRARDAASNVSDPAGVEIVTPAAFIAARFG
ncbi:MAG: metallophosphoesterase [Actinomycetota bacterium]